MSRNKKKRPSSTDYSGGKSRTERRVDNSKQKAETPKSNSAPESAPADNEKPERPGTSAKEAETQDRGHPDTYVPNNRGPAVPKGYNNDPEWYSKDSALVLDTANIPFSEALGTSVDLVDDNQTLVMSTDNPSAPGAKSAGTASHRSVEGICTAFTKSSFGASQDIRDPLNVCATALYAQVRYANNGRKNYDQTDLFLYCGSMADVYSYAIWCTRIYAKAFIFSQRNRYVGKALLESERIDANSIVNNLANFRYWLNSFINKISSFAIPSDIAYFQRRAWMYGHVYLENPDANIKDQLYQFAPDGFYRFELDSAGAGCLIYSRLTEILGHTNLMDINDIMTIGNWLLANITGDEDFGLMSGDVLKAFNGNIIGMAPIGEVVELLPVYSEYVLLQFKNSVILPIPRSSFAQIYETMSNNVQLKTGNVYQSPNGLLKSMEAMPGLASANVFEMTVVANMRHVLSVSTPTPNPIDVMEITRLLPCGKGYTNNTGAQPVYQLSTGADIIVSVNFSRFNEQGALVTTLYAQNLVNLSSPNTATLAILDSLSKFKYAPMMYAYQLLGGDGTAANPYILDDVHLWSEVDNYTIIGADQLTRIHEVAMLSLFWVPGIARMVNF